MNEVVYKKILLCINKALITNLRTYLDKLEYKLFKNNISKILHVTDRSVRRCHPRPKHEQYDEVTDPRIRLLSCFNLLKPSGNFTYHQF
jgi:hypothetical protein